MNVIPIGGITKLDLNPDQILEHAVGKLEGVVILGYDHEEDEYFASSYADGGDVLWLLERCKQALMATPEQEQQ